MDLEFSSGRWGEDQVLSFLKSRGELILARRFQFRSGPYLRGEVDLIYVSKTNALVFVEVKTRRGSAVGGALGALTPVKQARIRRAVAGFLAQQSDAFRQSLFEIRIDVWIWDARMGWREIQDAI